MTYKPAHVHSMAHLVLACRHTPAVAVQDGRVMKLSEIKLKGNS